MLGLDTGGETLAVDCAPGWLSDLVHEASDGMLLELGDRRPTVHLVVERGSRELTLAHPVVVTRDAAGDGGDVLLRDACSSGFDLLLEPRGDELHVTARYRPSSRTALANRVLRSRFHLLLRQTLLHYPVMWWAGRRDRAPLHLSVVSGPYGVAALAGPGGVGKSTLVQASLVAGEAATADNLVVSDGHVAHGIVEPMRIEGGSGRHMPHGRAETAMVRRMASLRPDLVVVLRRGDDGASGPVAVSAEAATRAIVAGTYSAGELRRFWSFAAVVALGTGLGPDHPPVGAAAATLARNCRCVGLDIGAASRGEPLASRLLALEAIS